MRLLPLTLMVSLVSLMLASCNVPTPDSPAEEPEGGVEEPDTTEENEPAKTPATEPPKNGENTPAPVVAPPRPPAERMALALALRAIDEVDGSCSRGDGFACQESALRYRHGVAAPIDTTASDRARTSALAALTASCDSKEAGACFMLGQSYRSATVVELVDADWSRAIEAFTAACGLGNARACRTLKTALGSEETESDLRALIKSSLEPLCFEQDLLEACLSLSAAAPDETDPLYPHIDALRAKVCKESGRDPAECSTFSSRLDVAVAEPREDRCAAGSWLACERLALASHDGADDGSIPKDLNIARERFADALTHARTVCSSPADDSDAAQIAGACFLLGFTGFTVDDGNSLRESSSFRTRVPQIAELIEPDHSRALVWNAKACDLGNGQACSYANWLVTEASLPAELRTEAVVRRMQEHRLRAPSAVLDALGAEDRNGQLDALGTVESEAAFGDDRLTRLWFGPLGAELGEWGVRGLQEDDPTTHRVACRSFDTWQLRAGPCWRVATSGAPAPIDAASRLLDPSIAAAEISKIRTRILESREHLLLSTEGDASQSLAHRLTAGLVEHKVKRAVGWWIVPSDNGVTAHFLWTDKGARRVAEWRDGRATNRDAKHFSETADVEVFSVAPVKWNAAEEMWDSESPCVRPLEKDVQTICDAFERVISDRVLMEMLSTEVSLRLPKAEFSECRERQECKWSISMQPEHIEIKYEFRVGDRIRAWRADIDPRTSAVDTHGGLLSAASGFGQFHLP